MSIKKLFESADKSRNYLSETNEKNAFKEVESAKNIEQLGIKQKTARKANKYIQKYAIHALIGKSTIQFGVVQVRDNLLSHCLQKL